MRIVVSLILVGMVSGCATVQSSRESWACDRVVIPQKGSCKMVKGVNLCPDYVGEMHICKSPK